MWSPAVPAVAALSAALAMVLATQVAASVAYCCCGMAGNGCGIPQSITLLSGTYGSVSGSVSSEVGISYFGGQSPDLLYAIDIPPNTLSFEVRTCTRATDEDTYLMVIAGCPRGRTDGVRINASDSTVLTANDDISLTSMNYGPATVGPWTSPWTLNRPLPKWA